jgi:hypothetical protein
VNKMATKPNGCYAASYPKIDTYPCYLPLSA